MVPVAVRVLLLAASLVIGPSATSQTPDPPGRAIVGPRLADRIEEAQPADRLAVAAVLRHRDLPGRGVARRAQVEARQQRVLDALPSGGFRLGRRYRSLSGFSAHATPAAIEVLIRHPEVEVVYLDGQVQATMNQGNPLVGATAAHAMGYTGAGIKVAVLDSGIDTDHPDLVGDIVAQHCFCASACCAGGTTESAEAEDANGHGTSVAGIVSSAGVVAALGVAPDAEIVAVRVLEQTTGTFSDVAAGLDWVVAELGPGGQAEGVRVVNVSIGDGSERNDPSLTPCSGSNTANAIDLLEASGVVVFVSSGNDGFDDGIAFPACVASAISVGGVYDASLGSVEWCGNAGCTEILCTDNPTAADDFVCHSNSDELLDVLAPDWRTRTSTLGGGAINFGGTSAASPYAAGQAALLLEALPSLTPAEVRSLMKMHGPLVLNADNGLSFRRSDVEDILTALDPGACGNGFLESGEQCDDGNVIDGDCCSSVCVLAANGSSCEDGVSCTESETCAAGVCSGVDTCVGGNVCDPVADMCTAGPPFFLGFAEAKAGSPATSLTIGIPAGTSEDDLLIAAMTVDGGHAGSLAPPAGEGWAAVALDESGSSVTLGVWWKLAAASESSSHQFTWSGNEEAYGFIMGLSGHDLLLPIDVSAYQEGTSATPTTPGVVTSGSQRLILRIAGFDDDDVTIDDAGMLLHTTITMDESSGGQGTCSAGATFATLAVGTAVPAADFTLNASEQWSALTLAIAPGPAFAVCGNGVLEGAEQCDDGNAAAGDCCSASCNFESAATVCRAAVAVCDVAESCTGASGACPADALQSATTECRAMADACDAAESCDGTSAFCPADVLEPATTECRGAAGTCDVAELCTGVDVACPSDELLPSSSECRSVAGVCDVAELCDGIGVACPTDSFAPATLGCRGTRGSCDLQEDCTGLDAFCPVNGFKPSTAVCRAQAFDCDLAELCTGTGAFCPADQTLNLGDPCEDGDTCTVAEQCLAGGACGSSQPLDCDDGNACTADSCDEILGCAHAPIEPCVAVPSTSRWGQLALALLLLAAGAPLLAGRRRVSA